MSYKLGQVEFNPHAVDRFRERVLAPEDRELDDKAVQHMMRSLLGNSNHLKVTRTDKDGLTDFWKTSKAVFVTRWVRRGLPMCVTVLSLKQWGLRQGRVRHA